MSDKVSIATKPLVYSTFRYISNHVWNAIGEYVDNSIQSYLHHESELKPIIGKLNVTISFNLDEDNIVISDNAYGIDEENFERAFELANVPLDDRGLNEFGMGMKVSSIWLSNIWKVETSTYGEPVKKTVIFDLQEVIDKEQTSLKVIEEPCPASDHYTTITLSKLSQNKPTSRQIPTIVKHLASIYTKFLRNDIIEIVVDGNLIKDSILTPLVTPYYKTPEGPDIIWKKDINFEAGTYKVKGFIGILSKMSTNTDNGFLLFRRNKVIGTSYDTKFRPKSLCGEPGSPRYKRIYGELELDGFSVSFTKNSFTQDDDLDVFIEMLADDLKKDSTFKIFEQAQKYTPTKTPKEKEDIGQNLVKTIAEGLNKPIEIPMPITSTSTSQSSSQEPDESPEKIVDIDIPFIESTEENQEEKAKPKEVQQTDIPVTIGGMTFNIALGATESNTSIGLYDLIKIDDNHYKSNINLKNPFFERFTQVVNNEDDYKLVASFIKTMIVADVYMLRKGDPSGSYFRKVFNEIFGNIDV